MVWLLLVFGVLAVLPQAASAQISAKDLMRAQQRGEDMSSVYGSNPYQNNDEEGDEGLNPADTTKKEKRIRKPLESYFFNDSVRALHNFMWHVSKDYNRVKIEPLECFFSRERASAGAMYHSWVSDSLSAILTARAMQLARDSVRFDASFNHHDRSELYCTELVYHLYEGVGIDITQGRRTKVGIMSFPDEVIFPDDIQENKNIIKYFEF